MREKTGKFCMNIVIFTIFIFGMFALVPVHFLRAQTYFQTSSQIASPTASAIRITNTRLNVTLDPEKHSITARAAVTFTPVSNLSAVSFDLNPALHVEDVTDVNGQSLNVERDAGAVRIAPAIALQAGASATWTFVYGGAFPAGGQPAEGAVRLASIGEPVSYLLYAARWFPTSGDRTDRFPVKMQVHVPVGEMVFSSGAVGKAGADADGGAVFDFDGTRPGFSGTVIAGRFLPPVVDGNVQVFLIDTSGAASLRGQNAEVLRSPTPATKTCRWGPRSAQDDESPEVGPTPDSKSISGKSSVDATDSGGRKIAAVAAHIFGEFRARFGPLDTDRLDIVELPEGTLPAVSAPGMAAVAGRQLRGANASRLLANTIAHQWWGEFVRPATLDDSWITNGMCRYLELGFVEKRSDAAAFADALLNVSASALAYDTAPLSGVSQYPEFSPQFDAMTYDKGAMIFRMLRWQIGDAAFEQTLRGMLSLPKQSVSSADVERIAEAASHQNLRPFFTEWLDSTGAPTLKDSWTLYRLDDNKGYRTVGEIGEDLDLFRMPVEVRVSTAADSLSHTSRTVRGLNGPPSIDLRVDVSGAQTQFVVETPAIPKTIALDPERWLLRNSADVQVRVHILRGQNFVAAGDGAGAIREYLAALKVDDVSSLASYRLGEVYFSEKNYQAAANAFRDALHGDGVPKWIEVWSDVQLGKIFDATGQRERAVNQYREAIQTGDDTGGAVELARGYVGKAYSP